MSIETTNLISDTFTHKISPDDSREYRHQFITDENVYIHDYSVAIGVRDKSKRLNTDDFIVKDSEYNGTKSGLAIILYNIHTNTITKTEKNLSTSITYNSEISNPERIINSVYTRR